MTRTIVQIQHDHTENEGMWALANEVLEVREGFSPFDIHVVHDDGIKKDNFKIKHVPTKLEYLVRFKARGIDPFAMSVTFEVSRLEADCDPEVIGTFETTHDTLRHILIDAVVDHHLRQLSSQVRGR